MYYPEPFDQDEKDGRVRLIVEYPSEIQEAEAGEAIDAGGGDGTVRPFTGSV